MLKDISTNSLTESLDTEQTLQNSQISFRCREIFRYIPNIIISSLLLI